MTAADANKIHDDVYRKLRESILGHKLKPGERLVQLRLAERLNTSRTPIRRALERLEREGIVRRSGAYHVVVGLSADDVCAIHTVQALLESHATVLAASSLSARDHEHLEDVLARTDKCIEEGQYGCLEKFNYRFHYTIYEKCGHLFLLDILESLWKLHPTLCFAVPRGKIVRSQSDHYRILEALISRNADRIEQLMKAHILSTGWSPESSL